jgi:hypothetical protein
MRHQKRSRAMTSVEVIGDTKGVTRLTGVPNSEQLQLFDQVAYPKDDGSTNMALGLVMLRRWTLTPKGMDLQIQIRVFDGSPQDRLKIMREYGYLG